MAEPDATEANLYSTVSAPSSVSDSAGTDLSTPIPHGASRSSYSAAQASPNAYSRVQTILEPREVDVVADSPAALQGTKPDDITMSSDPMEAAGDEGLTSRRLRSKLSLASASSSSASTLSLHPIRDVDDLFPRPPPIKVSSIESSRSAVWEPSPNSAPTPTRLGLSSMGKLDPHMAKNHNSVKTQTLHHNQTQNNRGTHFYGNGSVLQAAQSAKSMGDMARYLGEGRSPMSRTSVQQSLYNTKLLRESMRILDEALAKEPRTQLIMLTRQEALVCQRALAALVDPEVDDVKRRVDSFPDDVKQYLLNEFAESQPMRRLASARSLHSVGSGHISLHSARSTPPTRASSFMAANLNGGINGKFGRKSSLPEAPIRNILGDSGVESAKGNSRRIRAFSSNDVDYISTGIDEDVSISDDDSLMDDDVDIHADWHSDFDSKTPVPLENRPSSPPSASSNSTCTPRKNTSSRASSPLRSRPIKPPSLTSPSFQHPSLYKIHTGNAGGEQDIEDIEEEDAKEVDLGDEEDSAAAQAAGDCSNSDDVDEGECGDFFSTNPISPEKLILNSNSYHRDNCSMTINDHNVRVDPLAISATDGSDSDDLLSGPSFASVPSGEPLHLNTSTLLPSSSMSPSLCSSGSATNPMQQLPDESPLGPGLEPATCDAADANVCDDRSIATDHGANAVDATSESPASNLKSTSSHERIGKLLHTRSGSLIPLQCFDLDKTIQVATAAKRADEEEEELVLASRGFPDLTPDLSHVVHMAHHSDSKRLSSRSHASSAIISNCDRTAEHIDCDDLDNSALPRPPSLPPNQGNRQHPEDSQQESQQYRDDLPCINNKELEQLVSMLHKIDLWDEFNIFVVAQLASCGPLVAVGFAIFERHGIFSELNVPEREALRYLTYLQARYLPNPYHNAIHGADVAQTMNHFFISCGLAKYTTLDVRFAAVFAALGHDVAHPGVTNSFLVQTWHPLALRYNDRSPLEMMHAAVIFELLQAPGANLLCNFQAEDLNIFRKAVVSMVLATENAEHDALVARLTKVSQALQNSQSREGMMVSDLEQIHILEASLHAADISASGKPWPVYQQWTERLCVEFRNQGDLEKERGLPVLPFMDRTIKLPLARFQSGFIEAIVLPLYEVLNQVPDLELDHAVANIKANLLRWREEVQPKEEGQKSPLPTTKVRAVERAAKTFLLRRSRSQGDAPEKTRNDSIDDAAVPEGGSLSDAQVDRRRMLRALSMSSLASHKSSVEILRGDRESDLGHSCETASLASSGIPRHFHRFMEIDRLPQDVDCFVDASTAPGTPSSTMTAATATTSLLS